MPQPSPLPNSHLGGGLRCDPDVETGKMWVARALVLVVIAAVGFALLFGGYQDPKALVFPALALLLFGFFSLPPSILTFLSFWHC
jgi:hypothetical protein